MKYAKNQTKWLLYAFYGICIPIIASFAVIATASKWIAIVLGLSGALMLLWDFLVWLFKADWRTLEFQYSLYALPASGILAVLHVAADKIRSVLVDIAIEIESSIQK